MCMLPFLDVTMRCALCEFITDSLCTVQMLRRWEYTGCMKVVVKAPDEPTLYVINHLFKI